MFLDLKICKMPLNQWITGIKISYYSGGKTQTSTVPSTQVALNKWGIQLNILLTFSQGLGVGF